MNAWFPRITIHSLVIVVSVLTYVLTTRVEHERRPPSIAIAWVLGMIAVPYLALPVYLFFRAPQTSAQTVALVRNRGSLRTLGGGFDRELRPRILRAVRSQTASKR